MKKLFAVCLAAVMAASLTSCSLLERFLPNRSTGDVAPVSSAVEEVSSAPESSAPESTPDADASSGSDSTYLYASMEEFVNSEEVQNEIAATLDALDTSGMEMTVTGQGNRLIYTYTFTDLSADAFPDGAAEDLAQGLDSQASVFETIAGQLKLAVAVEDPVVVVEYFAADGVLLCSQEFSAD